ncbi:alpha/beta hydrolase [Candidatus Venteria ishoeyi]|uniref:Alpha/beta hydrolase family protein n=1 Tax=Candidatus Venteria ishoeyi TaxID=1899563 RepID=A0A1H6F7J3_9GAMM|nr:alpha/beta fold hydrolase [Candidatus Venteria ishoeyi]MDM8548349.1 alpha/beta fold hydrolase [Candidatus Venteria ishoeyi]SEH06102.1 Alpha/beta hydrolase family protein [Candidatus Venteria ishoeyi]
MKLIVFFRSILITLLVFYSTHSAAKVIELKLQSGLTATASYLEGEADKPLVLLLHGFLQTREFPTVENLATTLNDSGYPVLLPTLSLGIDRRNSSLSCEAIHTHSIPEANSEIQQWTDWLITQKKYQNIIWLGHSLGSLQLLAAHSEKSRPEVKGLILLSLVYLGQNMDKPTLLKLKTQAAQSGKMENESPMPYQLSFCSRYVALGKSWLSYMQWSAAYTAAQFSQLNIPVFLLMGSQDKRIHPEWIQKLANTEISVQTIIDANHFFNGAQEFDLHNEVETILENLVY